MKLVLSPLRIVLLGFLGAIGLLSPSVLWAQQLPQSALPTTQHVNEYGRPGYPQITVYVWGSANTGVWQVEQGTDLLEFASVISQAQLEAEGPDQRTISLLQIYRDSGTDGEPFFESRIGDLFTQRDSYPQLQDGDILVLQEETKARFTWREVAQIVGTVGTILNTYLILDRIRNE